MKNGPYELVVAPVDYPGKRYRGKYCYEHHLVYWRCHGIIPDMGHVIHHKNHNKRDNRIDNLEFISERRHSLLHGEESRGKHRIVYNCLFCGELTIARGNNYRSRKKGNKMGVFCGRSCATKYYYRVFRGISTGRETNC